MSKKNIASRFIFTSIICFGVNGIVSSCKKGDERTIPKQIEISFKKEGELRLYKKNSDSIVAKFDIEIADNAYERETGLMYRKSMEDNQGMLFVFEESNPRYFYMKNTYIPLDLIYLNKNKTIVSFQKNAQPLNENTLPSYENAQYVFEINAGLSDELNLQIGDSISYQKN